MEKLSTTGLLNLFETSKSERTIFVHDVIENIESGNADAIKVHLQVKCMESIIKDLTAHPIYKSYLLDAAEKHGKKFTSFNAEFSIRETGVKYEYDQCNDDVLDELLKDQAMIDGNVKARQKFLQNLPDIGMDIVTEHGEMKHIYPPAKSSTTSVAVTLQ